MQKCRRERIGVYLEVYKDACDRKRMNDIQNAVLASLVSVGLKCEYKRFPEHDVILLDDLVIKIGRMRISIVRIQDIDKTVLIIVRDLGNKLIVLEELAFLCFFLSSCPV